MCLKFSFQSRQAGLFSNAQFCWHNYFEKKSFTDGLFMTKMCIFFDKKTLAILLQKIATKKCPPLDFVKKTKGGQAGNDTFL